MPAAPVRYHARMSETAPPAGTRRRARDLGISLGRYKPGKWNAITDVAGVQVGLPLIELTMLRDLAGMAPPEVITAATPNGAHVCNLEKELGTLEGG